MRLAHRFAQVHWVVDDGENRHDIAMPDEMFSDRSSIALRDSVGTNPSALEMGGGHGQYIAFVFPGREAGERVGRIRWRVRAPIHVYSSIDLRNLPPIS